MPLACVYRPINFVYQKLKFIMRVPNLFIYIKYFKHLWYMYNYLGKLFLYLYT